MMHLPDLTEVRDLMDTAVGQVFPCGQLQIHWRDQVIFSQGFGKLRTDQACGLEHQFDIASLTKLFTATALIRIAADQDLDLDSPLYPLLAEISDLRPIHSYEDPLCPGQTITLSTLTEPQDPKQVTWRHLLTHSSGLPPWRPLYRCLDRQAAVEMALSTFFCYTPGTQVRYSDLGFIWLGIGLERLTGLPLDQVIQQQVIDPLELKHTTFRPILGDPIPGPQDPPTIAPTEWCQWRARRIWGQVHDENAARLGGIAGHAGLFSTATDLARLGTCFLSEGEPLLSRPSRDQMIQLQAQFGTHRRGLGFALRSSDPEASSYPLSPQAFGHTGFTGTSLWIDPQQELVIACLTNSVYYGRDHGEILPFRVALHRAIRDAISGPSAG